MTKYQILIALRNNHGRMPYTNLLSLNLVEHSPNARNDKALIRSMIADGLISGRPEAFGVIAITDKGALMLLDKEQADDDLSKEMAKKQAEEKRNRKLQLLDTILGAFIGALLTFLIQAIFS